MTNVWYEPMIIYKKKFKNEKIREYVFLHIKYLIVTIVSLVLTFTICNQIPFHNIYGVLLRGLISVSIALLVSVVVNRKTKEYILIRVKFLSFIRFQRRVKS